MVALQDEEIEIQYEALSYSWGRPDFTISIQCNGVSVPVTRHLADALRHLRLSNASRYIWTDAICINQFNLVEKASQVQIMFTIFKRAKGVIGWLGLSTEHNYKVLSFLAAVPNAIDYSRHTMTNAMVPRDFHSHLIDRISAIGGRAMMKEPDQECLNIQRSLREALRDLVGNNAWFERTWIVSSLPLFFTFRACLSLLSAQC
jgi:hypothetical protein